jgi:hypothetical protein
MTLARMIIHHDGTIFREIPFVGNPAGSICACMATGPYCRTGITGSTMCEGYSAEW